MPDPTDRDLLRLAARGDAAAFSDFYRRYVRVLLAFFLRRTGDPVIAADLAAETFATVVERCEEPEHEDAAQWLFGLERLPAAEREAVRARILDERSYGEIASRLRCSGAVVRQRVSRGLRALASELEDAR